MKHMNIIKNIYYTDGLVKTFHRPTLWAKGLQNFDVIHDPSG